MVTNRGLTRGAPAPFCPLLFPSLQEPEEKKVVRELLETEQAYVARLHLLDQASGQHPQSSTSVPCPPPALVLRAGLGALGLKPLNPVAGG